LKERYRHRLLSCVQHISMFRISYIGSIEKEFLSCSSCTDSSTARRRTWPASHHLQRGRPSCPLRSKNGKAKKTSPHKRTSSNGPATDRLNVTALAATDGRTTRPAASLGPPLRPGCAVTDGRTTRPSAAASPCRPLRPGRAAYDGRTQICAPQYKAAQLRSGSVCLPGA
jgi:hypothetical protein